MRGCLHTGLLQHPSKRAVSSADPHPPLRCRPVLPVLCMLRPSMQVLEEKDVIVEFMHLHWGLKKHNPVSRVSGLRHGPTVTVNL